MRISNDNRNQIAKELRRCAADTLDGLSFQRKLAEITRAGDTSWRGVMRRAAELIEPQPIDGNTSDGYHTFNELYHHRAVLFSVIVAKFADRAWKSKLHADGTMYEGMFIVGIETPDGQATYHYDVEPYWNLFRCKEVDRAPEWDGHTPDQAIERISKLVDLIDRPTCRNIGGEEGTNGEHYDFFCSACGYAGDFAEPNYCPNCGAEVVHDA